MDKGFDKFSIRELLIIIIPGFYATALVAPLLNSFFSLSVSNNFIISILYLIFSLSIGFFLYFLDIPKKIPFFKNNLPINILRKEFTEIDNIKLDGIFYSFFDKEISAEQKIRTNFYTSTFHFSVNICILSFFITISYALFQKGYFHGYGLITALICIINFFNSLGIFYCKGKVKYMFKRQLERFKASQEFSKLKSQI